MKFSRLVFCSIVVAFLSSAQAVYAAIDPAAAVVKLRISCTENSVTLANCFTSMATLTDWMANTRTPKPNATTPLKVEMGPGTFNHLTMTCDPAGNYTGYIAFEGSGRSQTIIKGVTISSCTDLSFSHLSVNGVGYGAIIWNDGGNSNWIDVAVNGVALAWYEESCGSQKGNHYWFGSKLFATTAFTIANTYRASCDESWFFGSEITISVPSGQNATGGAAILAFDNGVIHVYGSALRALIDGSTTSDVMAVARLGQTNTPGTTGGEIHIHGTGIDAISQTGKNVVALYATGNGMIHANTTAYNMSTSGTKMRIQKAQNFTGHVHAPYLWEEHPEVPNITSVNGADMAVVTNTLNGQPHLVLYSDTCQSKWFDTATQACR